MTGFVAALGLAGSAAAAVLQAQGDAFAPADCTVERLQAKAARGTTITAAAMVDAAERVPAHCRVDGHTESPGNTVNFRLGLPVRWNGKFYFQGVGGLAGTIGSLNTGLTRGYASASTDTGHTTDDPTWGQDRAKEIDYGHRGTHVATVAAKALTAAAYGRPLQQAYFNGCSNGGRQALMEVQRYPEDFTGIIAGDPAMGTPMQVGRALVYQHMLASASNDLPAEKVDLISKASLDGVRRQGWTRGRSHHRSAPLHVQAGDAEMHRARRSGLPDGRPGRNRVANLLGGEAAGRRDLHAGLPRRP